jgi:hypothetical protein
VNENRALTIEAPARADARHGPPPRVLIPLFAGLGAAAILLLNPTFAVDDAYITLHNARSLLAGGDDPAYGGAAIIGATSLVHLALLAGLGLILPLEPAGHLLTVAAVVLYAAGLVQLAARHRVNAWMVAGLGLLPAYVPFALTNGLETGLAMAVAIWLIVLMDRPALGWLAGLAAFVRPELALLAAILVLRRLWLVRAEPRGAAALVGTALLAAGPFLLWSWSVTGALVPATGGAKIAYFAEISSDMASRLDLAMRSLWRSWLLPLGLCAFGLLRIQGGKAVLGWMLLWLGLSVWSFPGGLSHNLFRYLSLLVPALVLGWIGLATSLGHGWPRRGLQLLSVLILLTGAVGLYQRLDPGMITNRRLQFAQLREDSRRHIPDGARVLVHDAGHLAWARPTLRLNDVVGLKSPGNIAVHQRLTISGKPEDRATALSTVASASGAHYLAELSNDRFWRQISLSLRRTGWGVEPLNAAAPPPELEPGRYYRLYRLTPPPAPQATP